MGFQYLSSKLANKAYGNAWIKQARSSALEIVGGTTLRQSVIRFSGRMTVANRLAGVQRFGECARQNHILSGQHHAARQYSRYRG